MLNWITTKRDQFEAWVATWLPGAKTKIMAGIGVVGTGAALTQEYLTGVPLGEFITPTKALLVNMGVYSLAYWFKRLADKE